MPNTVTKQADTDRTAVFNGITHWVADHVGNNHLHARIEVPQENQVSQTWTQNFGDVHGQRWAIHTEVCVTTWYEKIAEYEARTGDNTENHW